MAGKDSLNQRIVRTETNQSAPTGEPVEIYVCADGSRWKKNLSKIDYTGKVLGILEGNRIKII